MPVPLNFPCSCKQLEMLQIILRICGVLWPSEALSYCSWMCSKCKVGKKGGCAVPTAKPSGWKRALNAESETGRRAERLMAKDKRSAVVLRVLAP